MARELTDRPVARARLCGCGRLKADLARKKVNSWKQLQAKRREDQV